MDLNKLEGNSRTKQEPSVKSVVSGAVTKQKETMGTRIQAELNTQWKDVLLPAAKDMLVDMLRSGLDGLLEIARNSIDMKVYGEVRHNRKRGVRSSGSYTKYYSSDKREKPKESANYQNLIFDTRADATKVLDGLTDILDEYQVVTVGDLLDLAGVDSHYTDRKYGWFKLGRAEIYGTRDGYILAMPKPVVVE